MGREFELKFKADPMALVAIREAHTLQWGAITMHTTYYDTPEGMLSRFHWTLRCRSENGVAVCTVKTPAPNGGRGEWDTPCDDIRAAIPALCQQGAPAQLLMLEQAPLEAVCGAKFIRHAARLQLPECTVELALDSGVLQGGGREAPLCEVEVEVKAGSETAAVAFAQDLAQRFGLAAEPASKYRRALALAKGGE